MELLAPAGSMEALRAAVCNGADAVYLGADTFNARMNARNFSAADLQEAVVYCHVRGVKVHLTLNTLVLDREMPRAAELIRLAASCGVDAFIVQDLGVVSLCRQLAPDVPIHASTQMSIHSLEGVMEAAALGCSRARAGASRGGNCAYLQEKPGRDRGFCARRFVYVLFRTVLPVLRHRPPLRQPGPMRAALPPALRLRPIRIDALPAQPQG